MVCNLKHGLYVTFSENFTLAIGSEEISACLNQHLNSTIGLDQASITLGWISSGVYTIIIPSSSALCGADAKSFYTPENYASDTPGPKEPRNGHLPQGWLL